MGAVLGVSAYGRTQEKVAGASNVSTSTFGGGMSTSVGGFNNPQPTGFGNQNMGSRPDPVFNSNPGFGSSQAPSFGSSQSYNTTETTTEFSMTPAPTPGGRRPVTPNFNV